MSQYLLLLRGGEFEHYSQEEMGNIVQKYMDWADELRKDGIYKVSQELKRDGRVLSVKNGEVVDGPYTETKEAVGGFYLIEAKDYDEAVKVSRNCPHLNYGGTIELREINPH